MIAYIVKYQNNFVSSFLFTNNLVKLIETGIEIAPLLSDDCQIFRYKLNCDQWANNHTNDNTFLKPYNGSLFELGNKYNEIFKEPMFKHIDENEDTNSSRIGL